MNHIFSLEDYNSPLPSVIYLDTSFIYEAYGNNPDNKYADECYNFTNRLVANDKIMVISHLALEELEHVITKGIYTKYANRRRTRWDLLKKETDIYMPEVNTEIERITKLLFNNPSIIDVDVNMNLEFSLRRQQITKEYSLISRDASHVVAAYTNEINSIATVDFDYKNLPGFNIYTPNPKYLELKRNSNSLLPLPENLFIKKE